MADLQPLVRLRPDRRVPVPPEPRLGFRVTHGEATYVLQCPAKGWTGPYGTKWSSAVWECIDCGHTKRQRLDLLSDRDLEAALGPCVNGHRPCDYCGKPMPMLACGCARTHNWQHCPGKTRADRQTVPHRIAVHETTERGADHG